MKTIFVRGFLAGIGLIIAITIGLFSVLGLTPRAKFAPVLIGMYEALSGQVPAEVATPFTDIGDLPEAEQVAIRQMWGLELTNGCTDVEPIQFCPDWHVSPPQAIVFTGRLWAAVWGW